MKNKLAPVLPVIIVALIILLFGCAGAAKQPAEIQILKIGSIMPFTGPGALWGENIRPGMEIYAQLINEDGGLKVGDHTYKIELIFKDGQLMPAPAATAARNLVYEHDVKAIVGFFTLGIQAITPITNPEKVILNSGTIGGMDQFPIESSYVIYGFPAMEGTIYQALAAMEASPQYHVLCWTGVRSGDSTPEVMYAPTDEKLLKDYGIKSVRVYYPEGTTNFAPYLTKMKELGTEVVYNIGSPLEVYLMAKQRHQMGYDWPVCQISAALDFETVRGICGSYEAMQGLVSDYPAPWALKKVSVAPKYLKMTERIRARYRELNNKELWLGAYGGSACNSLGQYLEVVEKAGTTDPDAVMRTCRGGTFDTFLGTYKLTGKRYYGSDCVFGHPCAMGIIKGNEVVYLGEHPVTDVDKPFAEFQ